MKKITITLVLVALAAISYGQTYKKIVSGKDTLLTVNQTVTKTDTLNRKEIKSQIEKYRADKKSRQGSISELQKNIEFYNAEIIRLTALLKKTD